MREINGDKCSDSIQKSGKNVGRERGERINRKGKRKMKEMERKRENIVKEERKIQREQEKK
jgi:hypothetical protein